MVGFVLEKTIKPQEYSRESFLLMTGTLPGRAVFPVRAMIQVMATLLVTAKVEA